MNGIIVTHNAKGVIFNVQDYAPALGFSKFFRDKATVQSVALKTLWIEYTTLDGKTYAIADTLLVSYPNVLKVDSVDGVAPTSLSDLFDKLVNILA